MAQCRNHKRRRSPDNLTASSGEAGGGGGGFSPPLPSMTYDAHCPLTSFSDVLQLFSSQPQLWNPSIHLGFIVGSSGLAASCSSAMTMHSRQPEVRRQSSTTRRRMVGATIGGGSQQASSSVVDLFRELLEEDSSSSSLSSSQHQRNGNVAAHDASPLTSTTTTILQLFLPSLTSLHQTSTNHACSALRRHFAQWLVECVEDASDHYLNGVSASRLFFASTSSASTTSSSKKKPAALDRNDDYAIAITLQQSSAPSSHASIAQEDLFRISSATAVTTVASTKQHKGKGRCAPTKDSSLPTLQPFLLVGFVIAKQLTEAHRASHSSHNHHHLSSLQSLSSLRESDEVVRDSGGGATSHDDDNENWASASSTSLSDTAMRGSIVCGIELVWVAEAHRRTGIATSLIHIMRRHLVYGGFVIPQEAVAFSQPTIDGKQLAAAFAGRRDFLTFSTEVCD